MTAARSTSVALPNEVRELAYRLGAAASPTASTVVLTQHGTMRNRPEDREVPFTARQVIHLHRPEFEWRASTGPFGCISVLDALKNDHARLQVRAFRLFPVATVKSSPAAIKGEIMRYLAELAWAPDAILGNRSLDWTVIDSRTLQVTAGPAQARGTVELHLDEIGRIAHITAQDRPRKEPAGFVERPWRGRFHDYRQHQGRWLPFAGEVGWVLGDQTVMVWRGTLQSWNLA